MPLGLYMDHHIRSAITKGLLRRDVEVITAYQDGRSETDDPALLDRATALDRVLVSNDEDLLIEAARRQVEGRLFHGVIYVAQDRIPIGECIRDLELIAKAGEPRDVENQVLFLPL